MNEAKKEFASARHSIRYYKRQSRVSIMAFAISVGLLAFMTYQSISYRDALEKTSQALESQAVDVGNVESMLHYIKTLQGRVNSCRTDNGLPVIKFEKY